jgi:hypothetical protein
VKRIAALAVALTAIFATGGVAYATATADPALTPGASNAAVTQATIYQTICTRGYTSTIRNVSTKTKSAIYAEYHVSKSAQRGYVIDHLIPLEVGGSNDIRNLWPQPKPDASKKDTTENLVHDQVCNATLDLTSAQHIFQIYWSGAGVTATPAQTQPPPPPAPTSAQSSPPPAQTPGNGPTALCRDGSYSYAANHSGACSHHGGVAQFYK